MFKANNAGKNCISAIHPHHSCAIPVKSRKSIVIAIKNIVARVILIFRNIIIEVYGITKLVKIT